MWKYSKDEHQADQDHSRVHLWWAFTNWRAQRERLDKERCGVGLFPLLQVGDNLSSISIISVRNGYFENSLLCQFTIIYFTVAEVELGKSYLERKYSLRKIKQLSSVKN